jgi:hypothetical protein
VSPLHRTLPAVALAALLGVGLLWRSPPEHAVEVVVAPAPAPAPEVVRQEPARRGAARVAHGAVRAAVEATGGPHARGEAETLRTEDEALAARNRQARFETNVRDLRQAAAEAAAEGQAERAALLSQRADALAARSAAE